MENIIRIALLNFLVFCLALRPQLFAEEAESNYKPDSQKLITTLNQLLKKHSPIVINHEISEVCRTDREIRIKEIINVLAETCLDANSFALKKGVFLVPFTVECTMRGTDATGRVPGQVYVNKTTIANGKRKLGCS